MFLKSKIKLLFLLCIFIAFTVSCTKTRVQVEYILVSKNASLEELLKVSVPKLYIKKIDKDKANGCTAFPYKKEGHTYYFITASHCIATYDVKKEKVVLNVEDMYLMFRFNNSLKKYKFRVRAVAAGYKPIDDDFAILKVKTDISIPLLTLSTEDVEVGDCLINLGYTTDAEDYISYGEVNKVKDEPNSFEAIFPTIEDGRGGSGSPVLSCETGEVMGIMVRQKGVGKHIIYATKSFKFLEFEKLVEEGKYKYFK